MPQVSVFVPVYNEEAILEANARALADYLEQSGLDFEVIIGSNGSTDATERLGRELAARLPGLNFFHLPDKGPGRAFRQAVGLARSPLLVTLDMDLSVGPEFVPRAVELLADHDIVLGSKRQGREERSLLRVVGSGLYIACARLVLGLPYNDYSIGAKGFRLEVVRRLARLIDDQTAYVGNIVCAAHRNHLRIVVQPVNCSDRRPSRFGLGREALYRLGWLGRMALARRRED